MTDEHEHAMKVWREACGAYDDNSHDLTLSIRERTIAGDQAAAAVIEADRAQCLTALQAQADALAGALKAMHHAVCHETGFAAAVRQDSGRAYPWEPLDIAEVSADAALRAYEESRRD